ncbi:MAG: hypothetical protein JRJ49_09050 [Deltaproteobacteria bacterium]|nr:hypothetical protein [Deltaproteobacteria bacterium]
MEHIFTKNPNNEKCPFCDEILQGYHYSQSDIDYSCQICGDFSFRYKNGGYPRFDDAELRKITGFTEDEQDDKQKKEYQNIKALLSHIIRTNYKEHYEIKYQPVRISPEYIKDVIKNQTLPKTPQEQGDNLILWLGNETRIGEEIQIAYKETQAIIGAYSEDNVSYTLNYLKKINLIAALTIINGNTMYPKLTPKGWEHFNELKKGTIESKKVFMAMQFKDDDDYGLDDMFEFFQEAVKKTGFELFRVDMEPRAGSIPDHIVADIARSKFVIADLTYKNPNVYWEAGYAEALNKQVIYACERSFFDGEKRPFDIRHKRSVKWDKNKIAEAAKELKGVIRGTFPAIAQLENGKE